VADALETEAPGDKFSFFEYEIALGYYIFRKKSRMW
jgi:hypothetical protein